MRKNGDQASNIEVIFHKVFVRGYQHMVRITNNGTSFGWREVARSIAKEYQEDAQTVRNGEDIRSHPRAETLIVSGVQYNL